MPADLLAVVAELSARHPVGRFETDPFRQILAENIGYLIDDARRAALFAEFEARVGAGPAAIDAADDAVLFDIARRGGMRPETRVERWRTIAQITRTRANGDLAAALKALPTPKARALLKAYPVIGDPSADRILLFAGLAATPSLESNGLRTMVRLGLASGANYTAAYRSAVAALKAAAQPPSWLIAAHIALREHGKLLCKRSTPQCLACPLDRTCAHAPAEGF